ncbi:MAG: hypothetical protein Q9161_004114 [Pseudevernia consocians]
MKPMGISDTYNVPISDDGAEDMRQAATQELSTLPAMLHQLAVGSTWERSAEQSMTEYQLLDSAAQSIEILQAMNITDRDILQEEANGKKKEEAHVALKAMKYRVCPQEMQKTRNEMRESRESGCHIRCVRDCMPPINEAAYVDYPASPSHRVFELNNNPDGHWAIELLNFYSDGWVVYLSDLYSTFLDYWLEYSFDEQMEAAKQRAEVAGKIVEEIEKERKPTFEFARYYLDRGMNDAKENRRGCTLAEDLVDQDGNPNTDLSSTWLIQNVVIEANENYSNPLMVSTKFDGVVVVDEPVDAECMLAWQGSLMLGRVHRTLNVQ